jgi:hypothetical protein
MKYEEVILRKKDNVIYIDLVLHSMIESVNAWYKTHKQYDPYDTQRRSHKFYLIRMYDNKRFNNYKTLCKERYKYMSEIDLHVQMKRDD